MIFIEESFHTFKPTEKKAAEFILQNPNMAVNLSIQKLAERAEVSEASIIRLAKKMNCTGFKDLKLKLAYELAKNEHKTDQYEDIPDDGSIKSYIQSISQNNIQAIENTMVLMSEETIETAISLITGARMVAVYGIGASAIIAQDFKQKLTRINYWCEAAIDGDTQLTVSANLGPQDVVFGISYSGLTKDICDSVSLAKQNGAKVITLTKSGDNVLSLMGDACLYTTSLERDIRSGATSSRIAQLNVIDILFAGITKTNKEKNIVALERTRKAVGRSKREG